jgi:hypothetical protein
MIRAVSKLITGNPELSGNVSCPIEQKHIDPTTIAAIDAATKIAWDIGNKIIQQFSNMKIAANSTALTPNSILLLRHMQIINNNAPIKINILPIHNKVVVDKVDRFTARNYVKWTPFAWSINKIPILMLPPKAIVIKIQIIIPVQQLIIRRKTKEAAIVHKAAATKIGHPWFKLNAHKL